MREFCHLHCHTSYSLLDGVARIESLVGQAANQGMRALGITDHGNLFGVPEFYTTARRAGLIPVIGCEFYVSATGMRERRDRVRYHQVLWAKSQQGYRNLVRLSSRSFLEGFYYKPRIDFELLSAHSEGLVATTCCLQGEVPQTILRKGERAGREVFARYHDLFGEDYYIELQHHGIEEQERANAVLLKWAGEFGVKVVATNDVHYVKQEDAAAQDILLCLQTGKDLNDPTRMRFENDQFYLKTGAEMEQAMASIDPRIAAEALAASAEIADKCRFDIAMDNLLMPHYAIPEAFEKDIDAYLHHLVFERAQRRYPEMGADIVARLERELGIIQEMGYAGYFLIVQDLTTTARELGVAVGPGRGSAAGSAVAYCLGITNIDPLQYGLLFERFLNPERVSMPDIDIDFDDRGRTAVIDYVVQKYGRKNVCQIITFGTMGARSVIRDVARVLGIPLSEVDRIAKMIPEGPKVTLASAMESVKEFGALKKDSREPIRKLMQYAEALEGSARHTGVHPAGVIIAPGAVSEYVPVASTKNKGDQVLTTQYDGNWVERFGLLKMDLLGLSTLTVLKDAIALIKENHGVNIDLDALPLDDGKTFELFQRGDTTGVFQFESPGMREWIAKLKPTGIDDLIAMNALYRPGPMDLVPNYIRRKHGQEKITYPHPMLKPVLEKTYGIPVYQEQVMEMAQVMGGYTLGGADLLRRAMGKKKKKEMKAQRAVFVEGARRREVDARTANEAFDMMAKFAGYGFNKCLSGGAELLHAETGERTTLESLFSSGSASFVVHALGADEKLRPRRVTDVVWNGHKMIHQVSTLLGKKISATAEHRFLTPEGWKQLEALREGDRIAAPRALVAAADRSWSADHLLREADRIALSCSRRHAEPLRAGVSAGRAWGERAPAPIGVTEAIFGLRDSDIALFLGRLWTRGGQAGPLLTTSSERLAHDVQTLLLRLRIVAEIREGVDAWSVRPEGAMASLLSTSDMAPAGGDGAPQTDVFWDTVMEITYAGRADTYDLTLEGDHNFVADGLIVHNSHSAAYSLIAYHTAYLKANYAAEFMAAALTNVISDSKKLTTMLEEARKRHVDLLPPSINHSHGAFTVENGKIRFGLGSIKGVGSGAADVIVQAREKHGPAKTLFGLMKTLDIRAVGKRTLENLARVGALDDLEGHRAQLVKAIEPATQYALRWQADEKAGQISLFGDSSVSGVSDEPHLPVTDPWPTSRLLTEERELAGFYVSGHPLDDFRPEAASFSTAGLGDASLLSPKEADTGQNGHDRARPRHVFCGIITEVHQRTTKKGDPIVYATLEDFTGQREMICFSSILGKVQNYLNVDEIVLVRGELEFRGSGFKILTRDVVPMWKVREQMVRAIVVRIDASSVSLTTIERFRELCDDNRGGCHLFFDLVDPQLPEGRQRLRSRTFVVDPTPELMRGVARLFGVDNISVEGRA